MRSFKVHALVVLTSVFIATSVFAQQPAAPRPPLVREGVTTKLSEHVYVIADDSVPAVPNVGIIVGSRAVLVIDTGLGRKNGETVLRETQKLSGNRALYLVTTHVHPEHDLGAQAFPESTKMIRAKAQERDIAESGKRMAEAFSSRSPVMAELLMGAEFRKADITFDDAYTLDLGGVKVRLIAMGANHTPGDTCMFVESDNVLFSGDVVMRALPAFANPASSVKHWLSSLDKLEQLGPAKIVPSHGPIGDASYIAAYRRYLTRVRERTAALKAEGKSVDDAVAAVTAELATDYPETGRIAGAVRAAYAGT